MSEKTENIFSSAILSLDIAMLAELQRTEARLHNIVERNADAILVIDQKGMVLYANIAAEFLFDREREELLSEHFGFPFVKGETTEINIVREDGKAVIAEMRVVETEWEGESVCLASLRDITERKKMEEELLKKEKLESIAILAGGIAHDFNNLLTVIIGHVSFIKIDMDPEGKVFKSLSKVEKAALQAKDLTRQLLTFSKGGMPIKEMIPIVKLIEETTKFVLKGSDIRCEFHISDDLLTVEADKGQISQVVNNLVINARQAMPEGGIIEIRADNVSLDEKDVIFLQKGEYIRITIKDSGAGIPKENLLKIFDPFFTTRAFGSGLGLSVAYSIVKKHGGCVTAESEPGNGAAFHVYLPASVKQLIAHGSSR